MRRLRAGLAGAAALLGAACGFKGPLYLPERHVSVVTHPAPAPPATPATRSKSKSVPRPPVAPASPAGP